MRARTAAALALALALALPASTPAATRDPGAGPGPGPALDPDAYSPVIQTVLAPPAPVRGSDGRYHLVYEVQLLNAGALPWTVRSVAVRGVGGRTYGRWAGPRVRAVLTRLGDRAATTRLPPGAGAILHLAVAVRSARTLPEALVQTLSLRNASRPVTGPATVVETSTPTRLVTREPAVLGAPLRGAGWVAADGCCTAPRHVWATQPYGGSLHTEQRFAIDWERLDAQRRLFTGDKRLLTNWPAYGEDVLAVADGTVVHAVDDEPDQVPGRAPVGITAATADGNGVILRLRDGRFVLYAHLVPGSLTVRVGDRVRRGQPLGRLGNSGNSTAPHLHLHVMDRHAILGANGLPYVFDRFTVTGRIASTTAFNHAEDTGRPARMGEVRRGPRDRELPLDQVVVAWA